MKPTWVTWVIEKGLFVDTEERLIGELKRQGIGYRELQYVPFDDDLVKRCEGMFPKGSCVVFYGSLNFGRKLKRTSWIPGVYLDDRKYDCTAYYPVFGNDLLHSDYIMLPYGELTRRKDFLFEHFGYNMTHDCELFMRPNSGFKQFVGTVLDYDRFDDGVKLSGFYDVEPDTLVIVSKAKRLHKEWRFVVVDGTVISGSLYRDWDAGPETLSPGAVTRDIILMNSKSVCEPCMDNDALLFADRMAKRYNPEAAWVMDVALTDTHYRLLEIGCFSCAGMYGNDLAKVVSEVSDAAVREWELCNLT